MLNAYIALFIYIFSKRKDNIWLIGGHAGELYTDNSKVFYEYILNNHPDIDIYWVVNKNAPVFDQIKAKKVIKGSIKAYLYFYHSKVTLFSDTFNLDIAPFAFVLPCIRKIYFRRLKVYLSHGTIAFKKMPKGSGVIGNIKDAIFRSYDLAIASTQLEKRAMAGYGIKESNIEILGSARHDVLRSIKSNKKSILIAPTWRGWLAKSQSLKTTEFFKQYTALLSSPKLNNYLKSNNIYIDFYLHHMFHKFYNEFLSYENKIINILKPKDKISKSIMSSQIMVTDYSSICADFYYLQKPVLFFQFDRDEYIKRVGSQIDLEKSQFGEVAYGVDDMVDLLILSIENGFRVSFLQKKGEKYFINFTDRDNCRRIYDMILLKV